MLEWFDSTATLFIELVAGERDGMVDMSGLDSGDKSVVWVQVPPLVVFFLLEFTLVRFLYLDLSTYK